MKNLREVLGGAKFPASKNDLIKYATEHKAPEDVMRAINGMRERSYNDILEVTREALL
jgi:hypothetical protein